MADLTQRISNVVDLALGYSALLAAGMFGVAVLLLGGTGRLESHPKVHARPAAGRRRRHYLHAVDG